MLKIIKYSESKKLLWDDFVVNCKKGTLFHLRSFLSYHPEGRFKDHSLIVTKKEKLFSVFPAAEEIVNNNKYLISHPGASIGSFVSPDILSISDSIELVKLLLSYAKENMINVIRIKLPPSLYQVELSNYMEFAFFRNNFTYTTREMTSIVFLEKTLSKTVHKFKPSHRRATRKAMENGVQVRRTKNFKSFYKILKKNLKIRHGVAPTHTINELLSLQRLFPERCVLFGAYLEEKMIAGVVNFVINDRVILAFYISHNEEYSEYRSVNLLFYRIFDWAIKLGFQIYDFGIFTVNGEPNMGLGRFKENFGASGVFRDTIEIVL